MYLAAAVVIVCLAVIRLPDSLLTQLQRSNSFSSAQAGWAYRLLALAALGQAAYGGFVVLRAERLKKERDADPKLRTMDLDGVVRSLSRNAATMAGLTLLYGVASIWVTGQRGGFWLFPLIAVVQAAWYYRQVGQLASWLAFQPAPVDHARRSVWRREPRDYCPPLARGLAFVQSRDREPGTAP